MATNYAVPVVVQDAFTPTFPTGIVSEPFIPISQGDAILPILDVASNAMASANEILKSKRFTDVKQFGRTVWLASEDREHLTVWQIIPHRTNAVVGCIRAIVYQDTSLAQKDRARSFQMEVYPGTGRLRRFSWDDSHEVLTVQTNGFYFVDYGRILGGGMDLVMRWDRQGNLVSSNRYNRSNWGRVIGGAPQTNKTAYRLGPEEIR